MNESAKPRYLLLLCLLAGLAGCTPPAEPPLKGAALGGPFTLTNQDGGKTSDTDFKGKYRLIYFGYTYCPDVCPVDLQQIGKALKAFDKAEPARAAKLQPIFISVDPERDTPAVLKEYVAAFHPRLIGLTGTREQVAEVAKRYGGYYMKAERGGASGYLVDHSRVTLLFGPEGEPIAIVPQDKGADAIEAELERWVK
jgi:protein SCO1/2